MLESAQYSDTIEAVIAMDVEEDMQMEMEIFIDNDLEFFVL
jgi:hypothetical protein